MMQDWHTIDIEVRVRENHEDPDLIGQIGTIRSVSVRMPNCCKFNGSILSNST